MIHKHISRAGLIFLLFFTTLSMAVASEEWVESIIADGSSTLPFLGPRYAPVTIEYYYNSINPRTFQIHKLLVELSERHPRRVKIVFIPVGTSNLEHYAALRAHEKGKYIEFINAMQGSRKSLDDVTRMLNINVHPNRHHRSILESNRRRILRRDAYSISVFINGHKLLYSQLRNINTMEEAYDSNRVQANIFLDRAIPLNKLRQSIEIDSLYSDELPLFKSAKARRLVQQQSENTPYSPDLIGKSSQVTSGAFSKINDRGKLAIRYYCDLSDYCLSSVRNLNDLANSIDEDINFYFHPVEFDDNSREQTSMLNEFLLCSNNQRAIWPLAGMRLLHAPKDLSVWKELAAQNGFQVQEIEQCLESGTFISALSRSTNTAKEDGIVALPTMVIGDVAFIGRLDLSLVRQLIVQELSPGLLTWASIWLNQSHSLDK